MVYSAAIAKDNVELNAAASYGIPTVERSVLLGYVSRLYKDRDVYKRQTGNGADAFSACAHRHDRGGTL